MESKSGRGEFETDKPSYIVMDDQEGSEEEEEDSAPKELGGERRTYTGPDRYIRDFLRIFLRSDEIFFYFFQNLILQ